MKTALALDVGDARIGIAVSDGLGLTAQPLKTISNQGRRSVAEIISIVHERQVQTIVVGMPYEMDGAVGEQGKKVEHFTTLIQREIIKDDRLEHVDLIYFDERLTTVEASYFLQGKNLKNSKKSAALDRLAACIILDSYLQQN